MVNTLPKHRIICFGDSITQAQGLAEADRGTAPLAFLLEAVFPEIYEVYNCGVGSNTTALALDRITTEVLPLLRMVAEGKKGVDNLR